MIDSKSLTHEIKSFGSRLGFNHVGIAPPDVSIWGKRFRGWLEQGFEGEMRFLARDIDRRTDPLSIFPDVKSMIVVSMNYFPGEGHRECLDHPSKGYIANYALNEDYHPMIESKLRELLQYIERLTDGRAHGKIYVDTGPVLEKAIAVMAGLGWMGKHSLLISHDSGSWLLLGMLLLDIEIDFERPMADHCGECVKCIEACPTKAIVAPYILDARRCISYLLGELKGPIPLEMRTLIGNRIFGCDDCQWVCPWNRVAQPSKEIAFRPKEDLISPLLTDLMEVDEDKFQSMFYNSPIKRIKRRRFLRNLAVALGNSGDRKAIPVLEKRLKEPDLLVKEHAGWAIERIIRVQ